MSVISGIHNDQTSLDLVSGGFISIGWEELGDVRPFVHDRDILKLKIAETYPNAKPGAIPVWAGILSRFVIEVKDGDYVISPNKVDRTLNFGVVDGEPYFDSNAEIHPNRRHVQWLRVGVPRDTFSKSALHEIGSAVTLFRVKHYAHEFLEFLRSDAPKTPVLATEDNEVDLAEDEPNAERVDTYSRDFTVDILRRMDAFRFEHFVAGLLTAMGWRASATVAVGDGGFDVVASRDPIALEPPIIGSNANARSRQSARPTCRNSLVRWRMVGQSSDSLLRLVRTRQTRFI